MRKQGSGLGFVILIVVMAVVLFLVAKAWKSMAPEAISVTEPGVSSIDDHGDPEAGEALRSGQLPDLRQMRQETNTHSDQVQEALEAIE